MYAYEWDSQTGGYLLNSSHLQFSKEPRPVYYKELDILGFDKHWNYDKNDTYPYMWAEANNYWYRGRLVGKTKGGSIYTAPELIFLEDPEPNGGKLRFIDIEGMIEKNKEIMESLVQETIKNIYNTYVEYQSKIDVFYVAFSGGKDSVVVLDIVQRALPHNKFKVLFGDTGMEFPDTYKVVEQIRAYCTAQNIDFINARSDFDPSQTWRMFGPPSTTMRWCCSVHKTSPQIKALREHTGIKDFVGMAFTGIRGDESLSRSEYDEISDSKKHQGQYSCHPIIEWNSAELFLYIYKNNLIINESYRKGNSRAGCLVCPMSSGKHEHMKYSWYKEDTEKYLLMIAETSGKFSYTKKDMDNFIDKGFWKNRRSGRELNFGHDKFTVDIVPYNTKIYILDKSLEWLEWAKTIGEIQQVSSNEYKIQYATKIYRVLISKTEKELVFMIPDCGTKKDDVKFISLFRSVVVKSLYCVRCNACVAECNYNCISMNNGKVSISHDCINCHTCHKIYEHCLRYNSIRNKVGGGKGMKGLDRYYSFGIRESWLQTFIKYEGKEDFWISDGDGEVANKKKDAFLNFVKDADLVYFDKTVQGDKYTKYQSIDFVDKLKLIETNRLWAILLANLVYTPQFNWFVKNIAFNEVQTPEHLKILLKDLMENDTKGLGKRNIIDSLKIFLIKTPLGATVGMGKCDYTEKVSSTGKEIIKLNSFVRIPWQNPDPLVILYSLYKFAEACGDYYQFTLSRLLNHQVDSDGVSPTEIFGLGRETMEKLLNGLAVNYPEFISVSFTLDLDNITLRNDKSSKDVLNLF